ncbi:DUF6053 domain-containing protein [Lysobacter enzymogenes]
MGGPSGPMLFGPVAAT